MGFADRRASSATQREDMKSVSAQRLTGDKKTSDNPISSLNESQRALFNNTQPISVGV
jgi:hypothetical protein